MSIKKAFFIAIGFSLFTIQAEATLFSGSVSGSWVDVVSIASDDIFSVNNNDPATVATFNWGSPATTDFDNQFTFDGSNFSAIDENTPFVIGDFSYRNGSTYNSTGINGVSLDVQLSIVDPISVANVYDFNFSIVNTPNSSGNPVTDGDIVIATNGFSSTTFNYGGIDYTLNLLGFSSDNGATIRTDFSSPEGSTANAKLFARITSEIPNNVPEPSLISLLGLSFIGLSFLRRRQ